MTIWFDEANFAYDTTSPVPVMRLIEGQTETEGMAGKRTREMSMADEAYKDACKVADALAAAIAARDADAIRAIYADDIGVWHAATAQTQNKAENSGLLAALFQITSRLSYDEVRRHPIAGGLVEQHVLNGEFSDGTPMPSLHVSIFIYVKDGLITRIEEYFNSATFDEVWARMAAHGEAADAASA